MPINDYSQTLCRGCFSATHRATQTHLSKRGCQARSSTHAATGCKRNKFILCLKAATSIAGFGDAVVSLGLLSVLLQKVEDATWKVLSSPRGGISDRPRCHVLCLHCYCLANFGRSIFFEAFQQAGRHRNVEPFHSKNFTDCSPICGQRLGSFLKQALQIQNHQLFAIQAWCQVQACQSEKLKGLPLFSGIAALELGLSEPHP